MTQQSYEKQLEGLAEEARRLGGLGLMGCTGGNLSAVVSEDPPRVAISASGTDKNRLCGADFVIVDMQGVVEGSDSRKPSDETALHLALYDATRARAICHGHAPHAVALSLDAGDEIVFQGLEMQKAFRGVKDTDRLVLPVVDNSQDMAELAVRAVEAIERTSTSVPGILVRGHGVFAWGNDTQEAGRHLETVEWLSRVLVIRMQAGGGGRR